MAKNISTSVAKSGMNKEAHVSNMRPEEYRHAKNANVQNEYGNSYNLQSEHSNLLASKFKENFKVIGIKNHINKDITYFFLTNPDTGVSEIGQISNIQNIENEEDIETVCNGCDVGNILSTPLEDQEQTETAEYITLLEDSCNLCLNFSIDHPIHRIVLKEELTGTTLWWTDNFNPQRYLDLDRINDYKRTGSIICGEDETEPICLDCSKLRQFPLFEQMQIEVESLQSGGNLKRGTYEFLGAYCNKEGVELTEYFSITQPIAIFDKTNRVLTQPELADRTNYAIKLSIKNLDKSFPYYKIAVIQRTDIDQATSYFIEGVHPITDNSVIYTSEDNKIRTDINTLLQTRPVYRKSSGIVESNNIIFQTGVEQEPEWNLQPVVNFMGTFAKWVTVEATEKLYENGVNSANYKGRMRDEVYPHAIRFLTNTGYYTSYFPLISRPPRPADLVPADTDSLDVKSVLDNAVNCTTTDRNKVWQFYNTATNDGIVSSYQFSNITTQRYLEKYCETILPQAQSIPFQNPLTINLDDFESFTNLENFIRDNKDFIENYTGDDPVILLFQSRLQDQPWYQNCTPSFPNSCNQGVSFEQALPNLPCCQEPELEFTEIVVQDIINENTTFIEKEFLDYQRNRPPEYCNVFATGADGYVFDRASENGEADTGLMDIVDVSPYRFRVWLRNPTDYQETPQGAEQILLKENIDSPSQSFYLNYDYSNTLSDLQQGKQGLAQQQYTTTLRGRIGEGTFPVTFTNQLHEKALWFSVDMSIESPEQFMFEVTTLSNSRQPQGAGLFRTANKIRVTFWDSPQSNTPLTRLRRNPLTQILTPETMSYIIDRTSSEITINSLFKKINKVEGQEGYVNSTGSKIFVTIDAPIVSLGTDFGDAAYIIFAPYRCFSVITRPIEFQSAIITYDRIDLKKRQRYESLCTFPVPQPNDCNPQAYEQGDFAYWESLEIYPDNKELYDSSTLSITADKFSGSIKTKFEEFFVENTDEGIYNLKNSNFICQPIRHFKYPNNEVSPFIYPYASTPLNETVVYPVGMTINENVINTFLDIAAENNLITQDQRNSIVSYEIAYGDRTGNRSIQAKGIAFDSMTYVENKKTIEYANFPYNDLGNNKLFKKDNGDFLEHPYGGTKNNKFMFMSPDIYTNIITNPTEVCIEGHQFGNSKGLIKEVEEHPEWVILGSKAKATATKLATIEAITEVILKATEGAEVYRVGLPLAPSFNVPGIVIHILNIAQAIANSFTNVGRYRLQWLETIRDLGKPENFAYRNTSVGIYNYFDPVLETDSKIRGVSAIKKLKSGRETVTDRRGNLSYVNNVDREQSMYLSFGKDSEENPFTIDYTTSYRTYDNSNVNLGASSRYISQDQGCQDNSTEEDIKNIASPYFSLKNYNPAQYGTIESVKWLPTSYRGNLKNPETFPRIFGGDTFISRFAEIRKIPMFLVTAMGQAPLTPFEYKKYSNLGENPTFYCDYEKGSDVSLGSVLFPDFDSEYKFDCLQNSSGYYIKQPAKFYLYYHGIASYLVESTINTNHRYATPGIENDFYPNNQDYVKLTEQKDRSITEPNRLFYNNTYSKQVTQTQYRYLPSTYNKELYEKIAKSQNSVIYSEMDSSEFNFTDPWLIYKPNNYYHFPTSNGKLIDLHALESAQLLARFENHFAMFNAVDSINRMTPETQAAGTGGVFAQRPLEFNRTELGYAGTQNSAIVSCEYGHFWADAERGQVFMLRPGGANSAPDVQEISKQYGDQSTGMRAWFKNHLPFKIKNNSKISNAKDIDVNNPWKGLGIAMTWDSRYERVFLTKRDYEIIGKDLCFSGGKFYNTSTEITEPIIEQYEEEGYDYEGIEDCKLKFTREGLSARTNVYAYFDVTSMNIEDVESASTALLQWFSEYKSEHPNYSGKLYILPVLIEAYLRLHNLPLRGSSSLVKNNADRPNEDYMAFARLPENFSLGNNDPNPLWEPEDNVVQLCFVDEVHSEYHNATTNSFTGQPTPKFKSDYAQYREDFDKFVYLKSVLYPIPKGSATNNLVLQGMAAIEGKILTQAELDEFDPQVNVSSILTENPYVGKIMPDLLPFVPLKELGWRGVYDKESPASAVFNSSTFTQEITDIVTEDVVGGTETVYVELPEIELTNTEYFKDVSWTIAFSPLSGKWISYYDFKPNYYVSHSNYFQSGVNYSTNGDPNEEGLWSHLLTNRSYQVFYGKAYNFEIEYPVENKSGKKYLEALNYYMESLRYHNTHDYSENNNLGFEEMVIHNRSNNSGRLKLLRQQTIAQLSKYPKTNTDGSQTVLQANDEGMWSVNYFYNRVRNQDNNVPIWNYDDNQIEKELNQTAVSFYGKKVLERLRGQDFLVNLKSKETQHKKIFKIGIMKENLYN